MLPRRLISCAQQVCSQLLISADGDIRNQTGSAMRSCSVPGVGNSNCRQHSILQSLQVRINRAAALRKRCCCCSWGCSYGSSFTSLPYVRNHDQSSLVRAAAIEDIGSTSPAQTRIQSSAKQVKWTQQPMVKAPTQQHASKQKPVQRKGLHRRPPTKTSLQPSLRSAGLSQVSQDAPAATKDTRIQLRLSQLETGSRKHDPASCHRAVQALKLLVEGTSVDQLLADASLTLLKGWWRKLNQDAKATVSNQSGWRGSPQTCMIGDQPVSNARSQGSSSKQSLMPDAEQLHAKLLHIAQEMQPEQRVDLFLHRYHPRLVQLWLATGHQGWAQEYVAMLPPVLPTATYNAFVASCGKHHSSKTLDVVLQVCPHPQHGHYQLTVGMTHPMCLAAC